MLLIVQRIGSIVCWAIRATSSSVLRSGSAVAIQRTRCLVRMSPSFALIEESPSPNLRHWLREAHGFHRGAPARKREQDRLTGDARSVGHGPGSAIGRAGVEVELRTLDGRRAGPIDGAAAGLPDLAEDPERCAAGGEQRGDARVPDVLAVAEVERV